MTFNVVRSPANFPPEFQYELSEINLEQNSGIKNFQLPGLLKPDHICDNDEMTAMIEELEQTYTGFNIAKSPF